MYRRITQLITVMIIVCVLFSAGSYDILNLPQDARSLAMNNTTSAYNGLFLQNNPAAISMHSAGMSYTYSYLPANIHLGGIQQISNKDKWIKAIKLHLLNYGTIIDSKTDDESYAFEALVELGYKRELKNIASIGISGGYLISSITGYNSHLMYSKVGIRSRLLQKKVGIGLSLENMGIILKPYTDVKEPLPRRFRIAIYYKPKYIPLTINGDIVKNLDNNLIYFSSGLEFMPKGPITLRLGLSSKRIGYLTDYFSSDIIAGFSGGVGFRSKKRTLDIGFLNLGPAGFVMGFSIINLK